MVVFQRKAGHSSLPSTRCFNVCWQILSSGMKEGRWLCWWSSHTRCSGEGLFSYHWTSALHKSPQALERQNDFLNHTHMWHRCLYILLKVYMIKIHQGEFFFFCNQKKTLYFHSTCLTEEGKKTAILVPKCTLRRQCKCSSPWHDCVSTLIERLCQTAGLQIL